MVLVLVYVCVLIRWLQLVFHWMV